MIKNLQILSIFYLKLIIPSFLFSGFICAITTFTIENFGLCFFILLPTLHYLIYELRKKDEYYFFANFGFSKRFLWTLTLSTAFFINIFTKLL